MKRISYGKRLLWTSKTEKTDPSAKRASCDSVIVSQMYFYGVNINPFCISYLRAGVVYIATRLFSEEETIRFKNTALV